MESTSFRTKRSRNTPSSANTLTTRKEKAPTREPVLPKSDDKRKATELPSTIYIQTPQKKSKTSSGKKSTSSGKTNKKYPNTAVQSDTPNVDLVSQNYKEPPTPLQIRQDVTTLEEEADALYKSSYSYGSGRPN